MNIKLTTEERKEIMRNFVTDKIKNQLRSMVDKEGHKILKKALDNKLNSYSKSGLEYQIKRSLDEILDWEIKEIIQQEIRDSKKEIPGYIKRKIDIDKMVINISSKIEKELKETVQKGVLKKLFMSEK